jgi:hypothetical protein
VAIKIILIGVLPASVAGLFGYRVGANILNSSRISNGKQAILCGLTVALFSFSVFAPLFSLAAAVDLTVLEPGPNTSVVTQFLESFLGALAAVLIAAILFGWLVALVGATAGWLLYIVRPVLLQSES